MDDAELRPLAALTNDQKIENNPPKKQSLNLNVKLRKQPLWKRMSGVIINEDANTIGSYVIDNVVVPTFKRLMYEVIEGAANILFNDGRGKRRTRTPSPRSDSTYEYRSYSSYYDDRSLPSISTNTTKNYRGKINIYDLVFDSCEDAEEMRDDLYELMRERKRQGLPVMVQDFYDNLKDDARATLGPTPAIATKYGWESFDNIQIRHCREGWFLDLPPIVQLTN